MQCRKERCLARRGESKQTNQLGKRFDLVIDFRQPSFILNSVCVVRRVMLMDFASRGKICQLRVRFFSGLLFTVPLTPSVKGCRLYEVQCMQARLAACRLSVQLSYFMLPVFRRVHIIAESDSWLHHVCRSVCLPFCPHGTPLPLDGL